jgi:hypothetical protein
VERAERAFSKDAGELSSPCNRAIVISALSRTFKEETRVAYLPRPQGHHDWRFLNRKEGAVSIEIVGHYRKVILRQIEEETSNCKVEGDG